MKKKEFLYMKKTLCIVIPIVAVPAFDKKCNADTAAGYLHEILENAQKNIGTDCKKTVNGIEYICNVDQSSVFYHFRKAR